ncbi:hypothetical protein GALMADRAFT_137407 [Galerina marginata CBS 339.88]|uniref:Uncharacterized protein n=1 Tax=Galerina marginata (strain CBS 339.88) TaxID=685588 RepID=A0A067T8Z0_GALM3|nr:hypothetical protein GALMADRAFT_137407 [Galerina marginata CBS 339.88]
MNYTGLVAPLATASNACPASLLNSDTLWLIFDMNSDMFSYRNALETTRISSQVCREWRSVILDAPALWGKLIDLDNLLQKRDEWKDEVLHRSGGAPLSILGSDFYRNPMPWRDRFPAETFVISILNQHWRRIENLVISSDRRRIDLALLESIQKPAPRLRKFHVQFKNPQNTSHIGELFANQAPLLESVAIPFKFQLPAPWLSNIRTILIGGYYFYLSEIIDILKTTPLVENITVSIRQALNTTGDTVHARPLTLPHLAAVSIAGDFTSGIGILGSLVNIHRATSLEVSLVDITRTKNEDWTTLYQTLFKVLQDHFGVHSPTRTSLILNPKYFSLKAYGHAGSIFQIDLQSSIWDQRDITSFMACKFQMPTFHTTVELDLEFDPDSIKDYNPIFRSFFSSFSSIRVLTLRHERAIRQVHPQHMDPSEILFPTLETLKFRWYKGGIFATEPISQFLVARREAGYPISNLDLTGYSKDIAQALMSMDELEEMKGLKILWCRSGEDGVLEHTCGSGSLWTPILDLQAVQIM